MVILKNNRFIFEMSFLEIVSLAFTSNVSKFSILKKSYKSKTKSDM